MKSDHETTIDPLKIEELIGEAGFLVRELAPELGVTQGELDRRLAECQDLKDAVSRGEKRQIQQIEKLMEEDLDADQDEI